MDSRKGQLQEEVRRFVTAVDLIVRILVSSLQLAIAFRSVQAIKPGPDNMSAVPEGRFRIALS